MILLLRSVLSMKNWSSQVILKIWCGIATLSKKTQSSISADLSTIRNLSLCRLDLSFLYYIDAGSGECAGLREQQP